MLFRAAMAPDIDAFCVEEQIDPKLLPALRHQYAQPYIKFLEGVLKKIRTVAER